MEVAKAHSNAWLLGLIIEKLQGCRFDGSDNGVGVMLVLTHVIMRSVNSLCYSANKRKAELQKDEYAGSDVTCFAASRA